ncbi:MAG: hypothetical protein HYX69_19030 [Planctomycetia bacterium]|nr:hypothetical protein [Planctomycetia bacterium]
MFESLHRTNPLATPGGMLIATLVAALLLAALPRRAVEPLAALYTGGIEPGRFAAAWLRDRAAGAVAQFRQSAATAEELARGEDQIRRLRARNEELEMALVVAGAGVAPDRTLATAEAPPLVLANCLRVRVLGSRACGLLPAADIIAAGRTAGLTRDTLVLADSATTIDSGRDTNVAVGDLALAGRRVYGKVIDVGPHTALVRRADQPGYRDVVQLARTTDGELQFGPRGMLEGGGDRQCRVRLVSAAATVQAGDLVFSADHVGLAPRPLLYGKVTRVEARTGGPHWDIWVELAAEPSAASELLVLRAGLNPARVAATSAARTTTD